MKCKSRSTLGVIIGGLNVLAFFASSIFILVFLFRKNDPNFYKRQGNESIPDIPDGLVIFMLIVCLIMTLISALLIVGIVKRRHKLMIPWLSLGTIFFVTTCIRTVYGLFSGNYSGIDIASLLFVLIFIAAFIGIEGLILYKIYTLYKDIRAENSERPGQILTEGQNGFTSVYAAEPNNCAAVSSKA